MKILIKHVIRMMKEHMGRTVLIMMSLFVVSIIVAMVTLGILFFNMISDTRNKAFSFEYSIQNATEGELLSQSVVNKITTEFDVLRVPPVVYGYMCNEENEYNLVVLDGLDVEQAENFNLINVKNKKLNDNEAIISSDISKKYNLKQGDEFEYYGRNSEKNVLKVKEIVNSFGILGNEMKLKIVTNENTLLKIQDDEDISYQFLFGKYKEDNNKKNESIEKIESELGVVFEKNVDTLGESIKEFVYPATLIGILIFAVIFVSLNSIVKIIVNERIADIGTFRSIGATKRQAINMLVVELLMYTLIPAFIGGMLGVVAMNGITGLVNMMFTTMGVGVNINVISYILPISISTDFITVLFQILLSIFELIKVSRMSIKDTIFNRHTSIYKYSVTKVILGISFFSIGLITLIKHNNLNYWYCLIGIISMIVSIALIVPTIMRILLNIFKNSKNPIILMAISKIKNSSLQINTNIIFIVTVSISLVTYSFFNYMMITERTKESSVKSDLYVEEKDVGIKTIYDKTDSFYKLDGINSVSSLYDLTLNTEYTYDGIKFANHSIKELHLIYSNDYENLMRDSNLIDVDVNLAKSLDKYEIIVSDYYKNLYSLNEGDTIVLSWQKEENNFTWQTPINLKIVGFTDLSKIQNNTIIISSELSRDLNVLLFKGFSDVKYFINLEDDSIENAKQTRKDIIEQLGIYSNGADGFVFTRDGYINNVKENNENYMKLTILVVVLIIGISLIGIINNQIVSFMERKKELATLYSVAMSRKQLKNMILIENTLSFVNSTIASIVFYIIISKLIEYALQVLLIPISIKFTIGGILILLFVVMMILLGIQRTMRKHIKNMNVVEEIKYE